MIALLSRESHSSGQHQHHSWWLGSTSLTVILQNVGLQVAVGDPGKRRCKSSLRGSIDDVADDHRAPAA
jgi:hypothetical protein